MSSLHVDPPKGVISQAKENLAQTLADSTGFRTFSKATNYEEARAKIHFGAPPPPQRETYTLSEVRGLRPWAIIDRSIGAMGRQGTDFRRDAGAIDIHLEMTVTPALDRSPSFLYRLFENRVGDIIDDLFDVGWSDPGPNRTYLAPDSVDWEGPFRESPDDGAGEDQYVWMILTVNYDRQGAT